MMQTIVVEPIYLHYEIVDKRPFIGVEKLITAVQSALHRALGFKRIISRLFIVQ